jgi:hypothetical protein
MSLTHVKELEAFAEQTTIDGGVQSVINYMYDPSGNTYELMLTAIVSAKNKFTAPGVTRTRILVTLADGTVVLDTSRNNNSHANALAKAINENHNSRLAIMVAGLGQSGIGMEKKYSSSTRLNEQYLAHRVGRTQQDAIGCIRWSFVA